MEPLMIKRKEIEMKRQAGRPILVIMMILVCAQALSATQIVVLSPREMANNSALVLSGRVAGSDSYWNDEHTKIFTRITILVDETYKGQHSPRVELVQLGGIVGNVKVTVEGALQWKEGEEVLLFLEPCGSASQYQVAGLSQGRFEIERDPATGKRLVTRPSFAGVELFQSDGGPVKGDGALEKVPLEQFVSEVLRSD
jgi:hypothetical protein